MTVRPALAILTLLFLVTGAAASERAAPGAPGVVGTWENAGKTGIGTAYAPYAASGTPSGAPSASRVWFSVGRGYITETMYGLIHEAQLQSVRLAVTTRDGLFVEGETPGGTVTVDYLDKDRQGRPQSLAYRLVTRDPHGDVEIEKHVFTDPSRNVLFVRTTVRPLRGAVTPYLVVAPRMGGASLDNRGVVAHGLLQASGAGVSLAVRSSQPFAQATVGFLGTSDGLSALRARGRLGVTYASTGSRSGSILLTAALSPTTRRARTVDLAFGFGPDSASSAAAASGALKEGYDRVLAHYNGRDGRPGWETWLASLRELPRLAAQSGDGGRLAYVSAMVLKAHEDKTYPGALIASLSIPWGDELKADAPATGYKAVWPRDFYQCAMALAALGDRETPVAAFRYLGRVQVRASADGVGGWFQQKSHVDGTPEWPMVQLDQTAMPIMLGWKLWRQGLLPEAEIKAAYRDHLKAAADFLVDGGRVSLLVNHGTVTPPATQLERWEEQAGYSASTIAAEITGLVVAGDLAELADDAPAAARYRAAADRYSAGLEPRLFTNTGSLGDGHYYLRVNTTEDADHPSEIPAHNGLSALPSDRMLDAGFLELVRYGVRRADDPRIVSSVKAVDAATLPEDLRVRYDIGFGDGPATYPGFRRYGHDGYGEDTVTADGFHVHGADSPHQRGRIWPLLTGERGHYELALATAAGGPPAPDRLDAIRGAYVRGMEHFANAGLMLPEQVFDGVGVDLRTHAPAGQGTGSATPLAWAHGEYLKLLRSLADGRVFDAYPPVAARLPK